MGGGSAENAVKASMFHKADGEEVPMLKYKTHDVEILGKWLTTEDTLSWRLEAVKAALTPILFAYSDSLPGGTTAEDLAKLGSIHPDEYPSPPVGYHGMSTAAAYKLAVVVAVLIATLIVNNVNPAHDPISVHYTDEELAAIVAARTERLPSRQQPTTPERTRTQCPTQHHYPKTDQPKPS